MYKWELTQEVVAEQWLHQLLTHEFPSKNTMQQWERNINLTWIQCQLLLISPISLARLPLLLFPMRETITPKKEDLKNSFKHITGFE